MPERTRCGATVVVMAAVALLTTGSILAPHFTGLVILLFFVGCFVFRFVWPFKIFCKYIQIKQLGAMPLDRRAKNTADRIEAAKMRRAQNAQRGR